MGRCQCNSVCTSAGRIGWWRNFFLWVVEVVLERYSDGSGFFGGFCKATCDSGPWFICRLRLSGQSFSSTLKKNPKPSLCSSLRSYLNSFSLPSYHPPSFQPSVPLKCAIDRSLSGAPSLLGLAVCLCFISPTKRWARMRDLCVCVRFPLQLRRPNMKPVYLRSWQSFSTLPMLLRMIITWVCAWATMQCGQVQPQMVAPVEDINTGNVKTTLRQGRGEQNTWSETEREEVDTTSVRESRPDKDTDNTKKTCGNARSSWMVRLIGDGEWKVCWAVY